MMMSGLVSSTHNALGHPYKAMHHIMQLVTNMPLVPKLRTSPDARSEHPSRQLFVLTTITSRTMPVEKRYSCNSRRYAIACSKVAAARGLAETKRFDRPEKVGQDTVYSSDRIPFTHRIPF